MGKKVWENGNPMNQKRDILYLLNYFLFLLCCSFLQVNHDGGSSQGGRQKSEDEAPFPRLQNYGPKGVE